VKLSEIGEMEFINTVVKKILGVSKLDDVYHLDGTVYKLDGFPLSFKMDGMDTYDLGWKAVTAGISDVMGKGSIPLQVMVSVGLNPNMELQDALSLFEGVGDSVKYYGANYVGGDTNGTNGDGWIDVAIIGKAQCYKPLSEIKEGDVIVLTNPIGSTSAVFISKILSINVPSQFLLQLKHPIVNRHLPGAMKEMCHMISSSTDLSDGLLISLLKASEASGCGMNLEILPFRKDVLQYINSLRLDSLQLLKYGGEEYETLIFTNPLGVESLMEKLRLFGMRPLILGRAIKETGIYLKGEKMKPMGWDNFKGWS
jgi:thiamine-monophosphate kinase